LKLPKQLPKSVTLDGQTYQIIPVPEIKDEDGSELFGRIRFSQMTIEVWDKLDFQAQIQCVWHEIIHALLTHRGMINLSHEDPLVDNLAYGVLGLLLTNDGLIG
jgi:hypothetical protein